MSDGAPLHPFVQNLLDAMRAAPGGPVLSLEDLADAAASIGPQPRKRRDEVAAQLLVLMRRFRSERCDATADQLGYLFALCLGEKATPEELQDAGVTPESIKKILTAAKKANLGDRLTAPSAMGVGLRRGPPKKL